jgi:hypothetical protein
MIFARRPVLLALGGALVALAAGSLAALGLIRGHRGEATPPPPASQAGLVIDASGAQVGHIDAAKPLRCFVGGQFVGELTLLACAQRNGVATDALDVGVDASGALAAGQGGAAAVAKTIQGAPPPAALAASGASAAASAGPNPVAAGDCWRYADDRWRKLPGQTSLNGCAQALFAGRCEQPGGATYGRWGQLTLRLVPGRIEISADNHSFKTLSEQGPGCSIPGGAG